MLTNKKLNLIFLLIIIVFLFCADETPYFPEDVPGSIVGLVKNQGVIVQVNLFQGKLIQSVNSDSLTGYFEIKNVDSGVYNLEFIANNFGRYVLNEVIVYAGKTTATADIYLKPLPEQILFINPADNVSNISVDFPIEIEFSSQMNQSSVEENFSLQPSVDGYFEWINSANQHKIIFRPTDQYATDQTYKIQLYKNAETIFGDTLAFSVSSLFTTESVKIVSTIPEDNATYISPQTEIYIAFNSRMDREATESKIVLSPETAGVFRWLDSRKVFFRPGGFLASNTEYEIIIFPGAADIYGSFFLTGHTIKFKTEPLTVISHYPSNGATSVNRSNPIVITFNTFINKTKAEGSFSINPSVEGWRFQWSDLTRFQYSGSTKLQANTKYTVTIDSTCSDYWDNKILSNFSFEFLTGE